MWFLIKGTFYCTVTLVALSFLSGTPQEEQADGAQLQIGDAIAAASGAYSYVTSLCAEKPDVCETGKETFQIIGERAREGALVAYQLLDQQFSDGTAADGGDTATAQASPKANPKGSVEIVKPVLETSPVIAATEVNATAAEAITTGTVIPDARPKHLPKPYTPPKP